MVVGFLVGARIGVKSVVLDLVVAREEAGFVGFADVSFVLASFVLVVGLLVRGLVVGFLFLCLVVVRRLFDLSTLLALSTGFVFALLSFDFGYGFDCFGENFDSYIVGLLGQSVRKCRCLCSLLSMKRMHFLC